MKLDKRLKKYRQLHLWFNQYTRAAFVAGLIIGLLIGFSIKHSVQTSPEAVKPTIISVVGEVKAYETPCDFDAITYIRCSGEKLGKTNQEITTMIRIARSESNFRANAKNARSTASGVFQIIYGTWNSNNCQGNAFNFVNNIDCAWKIQSRRGFQPWNASKRAWNK